MKKRLSALLLGAVFCLLAAEAALRLTGLGWKAARPSREAAPGSFAVLCLGDSFTVGAGAPRGEDYPAQLERILNLAGGARFTVVNDGLPGHNTYQILSSLERRLDETAPSVVLLLAGGANVWNIYGYHSFRNESPLARLLDSAGTFKLVKLARVLAAGRREAGRAAGARLSEGGQQCLNPKRQAELVKLFLKAEEADRAGDFRGAALALGEASAIAPDNGLIGWTVSEALEKAGDKAGARSWRRRGDLAPEACHVGGRKPYFRAEAESFRDIPAWTGRDLRRIIAACRERGIPVVLLNYPVSGKYSDAYRPGLYNRTAAETGVPLADNYSAFLRAGGASLFSDDAFGHPNAAGYALMAKTAAGALVAAGLLPAPPKAAAGGGL